MLGNGQAVPRRPAGSGGGKGFSRRRCASAPVRRREACAHGPKLAVELVPLQQPPSKNVTQNVYYCSVRSPGNEGQADVANGIFRLSSMALNPLQRHLKSAHGIEAESALESEKQPTIDVHCRHRKAKNEKLLDGLS